MLAYETKTLATEAETKAFSFETGQDQDVQSRGRGETEVFVIATEASRGETEPTHYCASRWPRDRGVKTEATSLATLTECSQI